MQPNSSAKIAREIFSRIVFILKIYDERIKKAAHAKPTVAVFVLIKHATKNIKKEITLSLFFT